MKLVTVEEMRSIEKEADAKGLSYDQMMDKAGKGIARIILEEYGVLENQVATALVGTGNNGGDALVTLAALGQAGWEVRAYLTRPRQEDDPLVYGFVSAGGKIIEYEKDNHMKQLGEWLETTTVLIDGILGTGIQLPLKPELSLLLKYVNQHPSDPYIVAVDCPSGVDCNSGDADENCISADITVCMAAVKVGLVRLPAYDYVGQIRIVDLGFSKGVKSWQEIHLGVISGEDIYPVLPQRASDAHKGTFGTALVVAGSVNYTGAAFLAAKAAYRIGAGLVRLAVPGQIYAALAGQLPEATWLILPNDMGVIGANASELVLANLDRVTALLLGPGWGLENPTAEFLKRLLVEKNAHVSHRGAIGFIPQVEGGKDEKIKEFPPLVVDADGLKLLAQIEDWNNKLPPLSVLTPHPGEMSVLTGLDVAEIQNDRITIACKYARKWQHVVVLKGAFTVIAAPDGRADVVPIATPALARAGTGDVLSGMIVGLLAQGVSPFDAARAGAWLHARAGEIAAEMVGNSASVMAGDVLEAIPEVLNDAV